MDFSRHPTIGSFVFKPFLPGKGPTFVLTLWAIGRGEHGRYKYAYRLSMRGPGFGPDAILFEGDDFSSPTADPNKNVEGIMGFLTLRPGDTDDEYFEKYTPAQLDYCAQWAEALSCEVQALYPEE